ncbi:MAG: ATP-binding protein, partial [Paracoccaceae bacterium]
MGPALAPFAGGGIGLAVSGGSDSVALLHLAADWARMNGAPLAVVTVDHGLRAAAADEAAFVAAICARLGLSHDILRWDWDG